MLNALVFLAGLVLAVATLLSAVKTFVLPRSAPDWLSRGVFRVIRRCSVRCSCAAATYERRDSAAWRSTRRSGCSTLLLAWLFLIWIAFGAMFWATGPDTWYYASARERFVAHHARFRRAPHAGSYCR